MRKQYLNFFLLLLSVIPCVAFAQEASDFMYTGNTVRYNKSTMSSNSNTLGGAVRLSTEKIKLLNGNKITAIRFYQSSREVQQVKIFVTRSLEGQTYDYEQQVASLTEGWNEVELSQPFSIDGNELFIGCEIRAKQPVIGTNSNWEDGLNDWCLQDGIWDHASGQRAMCITGIVRGDKLPRHNIRLVSTDLPLHTYEQTQKPFNIKVYLFNEAVETIRNATVQLSIEGKQPVVKTVSGLGIPYLSSDTIEIEGMSIPEEGEFHCVLTVTQLNGHDDLDPSNNSSSGQFFSRITFVQRHVLLENFSTENCSNCPAGHQYVEETVGEKTAVVMVTHHCGFGTDDFTIDESKEYTCFYKTQFAPAYMLDRRNLGPQGAGDQYGNSHTPMADTQYNFAGLIDYAMKVPAFATIGLEAEYDPNNRKLTVSTQGQSILPLPGSESRLNIFITEDSVPAIRQNGVTGPYMHNQTMRAVLTGTWGEPVELEQGFNSRHETVLPQEWNAKNINVVAFLSNYDESDVNNRVIYNSAARQLFSRSGIRENVPENHDIKVYTKDGSIQITGEYKSVQAYDLAGKRVNIHSLEAGIYLFQFETMKNNPITIKVVIPG